MIIKIGQGVRAHELSTCSRRGARRTRPSTLPCAWWHSLRQRSCTVLTNADMASHGTCWTVAPGLGALHAARKFARCARVEAPSLWFVVGQRRKLTMVWMAADACVPCRNASRWLQARLWIMSRQCRDDTQREGACGDAAAESFYNDVSNNSLQREYVTPSNALRMLIVRRGY